MDNWAHGGGFVGGALASWLLISPLEFEKKSIQVRASLDKLAWMADPVAGKTTDQRVLFMFSLHAFVLALFASRRFGIMSLYV